MINNIKEKIKLLKKTGFFSIFISSVFAKIIAFLGNIVVVNILSKKDYGIYSYAINAMTILYIFNDFGTANATLQHLSESREDREKQKSIIKYAIKISLFGSIISGIIILLSPLYYPFKIPEAVIYTPILFLVPLFTNLINFILVILRANLQNKKFAFLNFFQTVSNYFFLIIFSKKYGIIGAVLAQYFYLIIELIFAVFLSRKLFAKKNEKKDLPKKEKKDFLKYSLSTQLNGTLGAILLNFDLFLVGLLLANAETVALYKVATTIPMALTFLPTCVMIYVLPYFVAHNKDFSWVKKHYKKIIKYGSLIYGIICIAMIAFSNLLFSILYKNQYNGAIMSFQILMIGFFFNATFRIPTNNILYSMRKLKINLIVTISSAILNILLNVIFINAWGMNGAAISTAMINMFSSLILILYVKNVIKEGEMYEKNTN